MIGNLLNRINSPVKQSPWQRKGWRRRKNHLIDAPIIAQVVAKEIDADHYEVRRNGTLTHLIERDTLLDRGWHIRCAHRSGVSNFYPSPEKAVVAYKLVVHKWA
jgi:hypothetical protein